MTKSQTREMKNINMYACAGMLDTVALALSALVRAARSQKDKDALMTYARVYGVLQHPEFVI